MEVITRGYLRPRKDVMRQYYFYGMRNIFVSFLSFFMVVFILSSIFLFLFGFIDFKFVRSAPLEEIRNNGLTNSLPEISTKLSFKEFLGNFNYSSSSQTFQSGKDQINLSDSPTSFQWPVLGTLTQNYVYYHQALDIAQSFGTSLKPIEAGIVERAVVNSGLLGNMVIVDHGGGYKSLYAHMDKIFVSPGSRIDKNTSLGTIGLTGRTTGPHVHLEVYKDGNLVNPRSVLP
ncbi:MAG: M23 family metallopeptidase [Patescibacteria group bacterium]|nr:M23 family metallopeptidase [Patescibacteria group bacterium]